MANQRITFEVDGMSCATCASTVQKRLQGLDGVAFASVNLVNRLASVELHGPQVQATDLIKAVREIGYDCGPVVVRYFLDGLTLATGVSPLERMLDELPGVLDVKASHITGELVVRYVPGSMTIRDLESAIARAGFKVAEPVASEDPVERYRIDRKKAVRGDIPRLVFAVFATLLSAVASMPFQAGAVPKSGDVGVKILRLFDGVLRGWVPQLYDLPWQPVVVGMLVLTALTISYSARPFYKPAWRALKDRRSDSSTLLVVAVCVLFLYSVAGAVLPFFSDGQVLGGAIYFEATNALIAIGLVSRLLAAHLLNKLKKPLAEFSLKSPKRAFAYRAQGVEEVPVSELGVGDHVVVKPNEIVPADGVITSGSTYVNEELITGESVPVAKAPGERVFAGTVNGSETFEFIVDAAAQDTTLTALKRMLRNAQLDRMKIQARVDSLSRLFVPLILAIAIGVGAAWLVLGTGDQVAVGVLAFVAMVAIASPNAVGFAASSAVMASTGLAIRRGIVFTGGKAIEDVARLDTIVFDKTGTLTEGHPAVTHIVGSKRQDGTTVPPSELLQLAASVEAQSDHPIAMAIVKSARAKGVDLLPAERFVEMEGRGVRGVVDKLLVEVISVRHAQERNLELGQLEQDVDRHVLGGRTSVVLVVNDVVRGLIVVADTVKADAKRAVSALKDMGLTVYMVSGDAKDAARLVGQEVGIDRVIAEVESTETPDEIKRIQLEGHVVGMVTNNPDAAAALAEADVGFSFGVGSKINALASDVTVIREDILEIVTAIELSRRTVKTVRHNVLGGLTYNFVGLALVSGVFYFLTEFNLGPMVATAFALVAGSVVLVNSLRLSRFVPSYLRPIESVKQVSQV